jgi:hypothetical protein
MLAKQSRFHKICLAVIRRQRVGFDRSRSPLKQRTVPSGSIDSVAIVHSVMT